MPNVSWEQVNIDYCGPLPSGEYLLVVVDRYLRFLEVAIVQSTKASALLIPSDQIFAVHGILDSFITENGPPLHSEDFSRYVKALAVDHHRITANWPEANREVEKFNKPLIKTIRAAIIEGKVWRQELQRFLL